MKAKTYIAADNIISSLGFSTEENLNAILQGQIGVMPDSHPELRHLMPFCTSSIDKNRLISAFSTLGNPKEFTTLEMMFIFSIHKILEQYPISLQSDRTLLILSTTKGNIELLGKDYPDPDRIQLWKMAEIIGSHFKCSQTPLVISNACISGALAVQTAKQLIEQGLYDHIIVSGGDLITEFIVSGFVSFKAVSSLPCKPFDHQRDGLSLGEGCGSLLLTSNKEIALSTYGQLISVAGAATSNDANHISGPSRTGEELAIAINKSLQQAGIKASDIGYISAHGTATPFNDEMESKAFAFSGVSKAPVNSLKAYLGHTLGAAGSIELILTARQLKDNVLFASPGFEETGTTEPLDIIRKNRNLPVQAALKTASGFGGCNVAVTLIKS